MKSGQLVHEIKTDSKLSMYNSKLATIRDQETFSNCIGILYHYIKM